MEDYVDFEDIFKNLINTHKKDEDFELIKDYPAIFSLISNISSDKSADGITKMLMNSAISYFILPEDIISEKEYGVKGYVDDFFICLHVLSEFLKYDSKLGEYLINKYWTLKEDYHNYISNKYYELMKLIEDSVRSNILLHSGVKYIEELIMNKKNPRKYLELKGRDLQRKIHYLFFLFLNRPIGNKEAKKEFEKNFFGTSEFMEFSKKLDLLEKEDNSFSRAKKNVDEMFSLEENMKNIRIRRLLG